MGRPWNVALWCRQAKNDGAAGLIRSELASKGVDVDTWWRDDPAFPAKCSVVLLPEEGAEDVDRSFLKTRGMGNGLSYQDFLDADFSTVRHIHIGGIYSLRNITGADLAAGLLRAREQNPRLTVSLDTVASSDGRWREVMPSLETGAIDHFLPSIDEAEEIIQSVDPDHFSDDLEDIVAWFKARGARDIAIKLGAEGAVFNESRREVSQIWPPQIDAVDTTAAGDVFCSGFLAAALKNWPLSTCVRLGVDCGTAVCMKIGSTQGLEAWMEGSGATKYLASLAT
jgi:sugar/nucleoside kinase (ribokinase family)